MSTSTFWGLSPLPLALGVGRTLQGGAPGTDDEGEGQGATPRCPEPEAEGAEPTDHHLERGFRAAGFVLPDGEHHITASADDEARLLLERVRAGTLSIRALEIAAYCGHRPAHDALGAAAPRPLDALVPWLVGLLQLAGASQVVDALAALSEQAARGWEARMTPLIKRKRLDWRPRRAVDAVRAWLRCPCARHQHEVERVQEGWELYVYAAVSLVVNESYRPVWPPVDPALAGLGFASFAAGSLVVQDPVSDSERALEYAIDLLAGEQEFTTAPYTSSELRIHVAHAIISHHLSP